MVSVSGGLPPRDRGFLVRPSVGRLFHGADRLGLAQPQPGRRLRHHGLGGLGSRLTESTSPPMAPTSRLTPPRYICRPPTSPWNPQGPGPAPDTQGVYPMGWNLLVDSLDHGPHSDPCDRRGRVRHQHLHSRDLLGGSSSGDRQQGWDRCIGHGIRRNGRLCGLRSHRPTNSAGPTLTVASSTAPSKFDDANRIESALVFG